MVNRGGPLERRTPLKSGNKGLARDVPMARGKGMARGAPIARTSSPLARSATPAKRSGVAPTTRPPSPPDPLTPAIRAAVRARSGGACEARVTARCTGAAGHVHHRKLRRFDDHTVPNLLDVCLFCHDHIHRYVKWSYDHGFLVRSHDDPKNIPVGLAA